MKVLIIEDEAVARKLLKSTLLSIDHDIEVVAALDSIENSVAWLQNNPAPDLVLLDIELGDGQSFEIFRNLKLNVPLIFVTAYQEHALRAFKLNSVDYLLKPVRKEELAAALLKHRQLHIEQRRQAQENVLNFLHQVNDQPPGYKKRFLARTGARMVSLPAEEVAYFYTKEKVQYIKSPEGSDFIVDKRLDEIETDLDPQLFFRLNRQFIANYRSVDRVQAWFGGKLKVQVKPAAYEEIIVSRLKATAFKRWLGGE